MKNLYEKLNEMDLGCYELGLRYAKEFLALSKTSPFEAIGYAYRYGFVRGQNSIKNQHKRKAPAATHNSYQGTLTNQTL